MTNRNFCFDYNFYIGCCIVSTIRLYSLLLSSFIVLCSCLTMINYDVLKLYTEKIYRIKKSDKESRIFYT